MGLVSKECLDFVKKFEGFYSKPYLDCVGVRTLGYGMTGAEIRGLNYVTEAQASKMLEDLLNNKYATPIKRDLSNNGITLKQNEFDALVSMAYNVGVGGVLGSTLYKDVCRGVRDNDVIINDFCMWCKSEGKVVNGLLRRRREEAAMFLKNSTSFLWQVSINGDIVKELQEELNRQCNAGLKVDGYFGESTLNKCCIVKQGDKGNITKIIQTILINKNYKIEADGIFGEATTESIKHFQGNKGLIQDGVVGKDTWKALFIK